MQRILITDRLAAEPKIFLEQQSDFEIRNSQGLQPRRDELVGVTGLLVRSRTRVNAELLTHAKDLRVIISTTSGFDHIDLVETQKRNIIVMFTPDANAASAAELTMALILACARHLPQAHEGVKKGVWRQDALLGMQLCGKKHGILGLGRVGSRVARMMQSCGMEVLAYDPYVNAEAFEKSQVERCSLEEMLRLADTVSLHVPLTGETRYIMNATTLGYLHEGVVLVNTSRGQVIHEQALCEMLDLGLLRAVGLDVFENEPLVKSKLINYSNVILSPHAGAFTREAFDCSAWEGVHKLLAFFQKGEISESLPPTDLWQGKEKL